MQLSLLVVWCVGEQGMTERQAGGLLKQDGRIILFTRGQFYNSQKAAPSS
jgi:hypothetical protein